MALYDKIIELRPNLTSADFAPDSGSIVLQNDGNGDYIKEWNHPTETRPTDEELD
tara:strand:+ start:574 stop:738 length:165 start_codon:yes stop_codon:yes gene_type:complete